VHYTKNATLRIPSEATGVWRWQFKDLATLINPCVMSWPEWSLIWLYVRSATHDEVHCSPQMTRSTRLTTAITHISTISSDSGLLLLQLGLGLLFNRPSE